MTVLQPMVEMVVVPVMGEMLVWPQMVRSEDAAAVAWALLQADRAPLCLLPQTQCTHWGCMQLHLLLLRWRHWRWVHLGG